MREWPRRVPLRVKLVAAVLLLVTAALLVIGSVGAFEMRRYLMQRTDAELIEASQLLRASTLPHQPTATLLPTNFYVAVSDVYGHPHTVYQPHGADSGDLPVVRTDFVSVGRTLNRPFTVSSADTLSRWRMLISLLPGNEQV